MRGRRPSAVRLTAFIGKLPSLSTGRYSRVRGGMERSRAHAHGHLTGCRPTVRTISPEHVFGFHALLAESMRRNSGFTCASFVSS